MEGTKEIVEFRSQSSKKGKKEGELPRLECLHNGIILIVNCFQDKVNKYFLFEIRKTVIRMYFIIYIFKKLKLRINYEIYTWA